MSFDNTSCEGGLGDRAPRSWFRFSLKTLLLAMALVAAYFGGRASTRPHWFAPQDGVWELKLKSGFIRNVALETLPGDLFVLDMGSNSTLGGTYRWQAGQLVVETPDDNRYAGLIWQWDGDEFVLVAEPPSHPAGPSYVGARMRFLSPDASSAQILPPAERRKPATLEASDARP